MLVAASILTATKGTYQMETTKYFLSLIVAGERSGVGNLVPISESNFKMLSDARNKSSNYKAAVDFFEGDLPLHPPVYVLTLEVFDPKAEAAAPAEAKTLRDYFAGQALAGIMANCPADGMPSWTSSPAAVLAYQTADAMIVERDRVK